MKSKLKYSIAAAAFTFGLCIPGVLVYASPTTGTGGLTVCDVTVNQTGSSNNTPAVNQGSCELQDLFFLIARITNYLIAAAALFAVFRIVVSGVQMVTGGGSQNSVTAAKKGLNGAITGLIIVMIAFLVINTIFIVLGATLNLGNPVQLQDYQPPPTPSP